MSTWLIQRLKENKYGSDNRKGIDKAFLMDYMGSAEFEFGALPSALKAMRARKDDIILEKIELPRPKSEYAIRAQKTIKAYFVGPKECLAGAMEFFADQVGPRNMRFKESTYLADAYGLCGKNEISNGLGRDIVGWWALAEVRPWAVLMTDDFARQWKELTYTS